jgi:hypothetical protein
LLKPPPLPKPLPLPPLPLKPPLLPLLHQTLVFWVLSLELVSHLLLKLLRLVLRLLQGQGQKLLHL